jgi:hypothetical protein
MSSVNPFTPLSCKMMLVEYFFFVQEKGEAMSSIVVEAKNLEGSGPNKTIYDKTRIENLLSPCSIEGSESTWLGRDCPDHVKHMFQ